MNHNQRTALDCAEILLNRYQSGEKGEDLLQAYRAWREATLSIAESGNQEDLAAAQRIGDTILPSLDTMVLDLLEVYKGTKTRGGEGVKRTLEVDLRKALRINTDRSPVAGHKEHQKRTHVDLMRLQHKIAESQRIFKSHKEMARDVLAILKPNPGRFGIAKMATADTVVNHWQEALKKDPELCKWASGILGDLELLSRAKPQPIKAKSTRTTSNARPVSAPQKTASQPKRPSLKSNKSDFHRKQQLSGRSGK